MNPKVAIVISNYNYGPYVIDAINSAISQDYVGDVRAYILDDGSSDDSWDKISAITDPVSVENVEFPHYQGPLEHRQRNNVYAYRTTNSGASTARNVAIWQAWEWADVFGILDADDLYHANKVSVLLSKLMEHDEIGVAYGDYNIHRTFGHNDYTKYESKLAYDRNVLLRHCMRHSGSFIKKQYLAQAILPNQEIFDSRLHGPGGEGFIGCVEDYDLWLRLSKLCMMTHVPEALSTVRETGQNQSMKMTTEIFDQHAPILASR